MQSLRTKLPATGIIPQSPWSPSKPICVLAQDRDSLGSPGEHETDLDHHRAALSPGDGEGEE